MFWHWINAKCHADSIGGIHSLQMPFVIEMVWHEDGNQVSSSEWHHCVGAQSVPASRPVTNVAGKDGLPRRAAARDNVSDAPKTSMEYVSSLLAHYF